MRISKPDIRRVQTFFKPWQSLSLGEEAKLWQGTSEEFVSLQWSAQFVFWAPPLQQTFATRIAAIEALKATHRRALAALDALFASLQQRAFTKTL